MQARRVVTAASVGVQSGWEWIYDNRKARLNCLKALSSLSEPTCAIDVGRLRDPLYDPCYRSFSFPAKDAELKNNIAPKDIQLPSGPVATYTRTYFVPHLRLFYVLHGEAICPEHFPEDDLNFIGYERLSERAAQSERVTAYPLDWVIDNLSPSGELKGTPERLVDNIYELLRLLSGAVYGTPDQRKIDQIFREVQTIEAEQRHQADETYLREEAILQKILEALIDRIREAYYPLPRLVYVGRTQDIAIPRRYRIICCDTRQKKLIYFGSRTNRELAWWDKLTHCILRDRTATRNDIAQVVGELGDRLLVAALPEELHTEIINTVDSGCEGVNLEQWR